MSHYTTWRKLLTAEFKLAGETWDNVVANTMTDEQMDTVFDADFGATNGCPFTVWTHKNVYFPICYDGAEWVGSVSRNPDGLSTGHQGGG